MATYAMVGAKFELGAALATKAADFVAADFTTPLTAPATVGEPESYSSVTDTWESEDFTSVSDGRTRTIKTTRKGGAFELVCGLDPLDAGQLAMRAAHAARDNYAMRFTFSDKPATGAAPKNSTRTFVGLVIGVEDDASGKIGKVKFTVQVNSNVLVTHASAT